MSGYFHKGHAYAKINMVCKFDSIRREAGLSRSQMRRAIYDIKNKNHSSYVVNIEGDNVGVIFLGSLILHYGNVSRFIKMGLPIDYAKNVKLSPFPLGVVNHFVCFIRMYAGHIHWNHVDIRINIKRIEDIKFDPL